MAHLPVVPACGGWQFDYSCDWSDEEYNDLDPTLLARAEGLAVESLRALTLGAVGNCPVILRPCVASRAQAASGMASAQSSAARIFMEAV